MLPQPITPTPSFFAISRPSVFVGRFDRAPGEALDVARIVVLHHIDRGRRFLPECLDQPWPVDGAVADIGPAVLIGVLASRRDVLDVDGSDARAVFGDP